MSNTFRKILSILDADIICNVKNINMPVDTAKKFHNHDGYEIFIFLGGEAEFYTERFKVSIEPGDVFFIQPYAFHHVHSFSSDRYDRIVINIREHVMKALGTDRTDLSAVFFRLPSEQINLLRPDKTTLAKIQKICGGLEESIKGNSFGDDILSKTLTSQLLIFLNRCSQFTTAMDFRKELPGLIANVFSYIETHLTDPDMSIQKMAEHLHHNSAYINRRFKEISGTSLQQYITAKKVALSQQHLREGLELSDACYASGFNNYSNFSRTFLKQTGMTPKQYQNNMRQNIQIL